uniref:Zn(2)-C6 fungal-type domain-containing protein n=1 Tax=Schizophyllum commune (strain H4-8 / FGSC 9210) TaxID=578458 RepID=D8QBP2_SCHCM
MATTKASSDKASQAHNSLQRGKACLRCRKRKMRCDGIKPACQQCVRAKKADCCEYDDGKGKTRTQLLRENIARLEARIRELEDPDSVPAHPPSIQLQQRKTSGSSPSSLGSPLGTPISATHSPFPSESSSPPKTGSWTSLPTVGSPDPAFDIFFDDHAAFEVSGELAQALLDIFTPHRHQCGLELDIGRLRESLTAPIDERRHEVLYNAIFLWACFVSRPDPLCQNEEHYLNLALDALPLATQDERYVVDVIQASCLLATYFMCNGRIVESTYHAGAAAAMAMHYAGMGLHLPKDISKEGERILTFWQVYNLDHCWSIVFRRPSLLPDGPDPTTTIHCPWPQDVSEYEMGHANISTGFQTVQTFLQNSSTGGFSVQALRAKASAMFHRADQISRSWDPRMKPTQALQNDVQVLELVIVQYVEALIPVSQLDAALPEDRLVLLCAHTLAHASMIQLFRRFAVDDGLSYEKCLRAARACINIIGHLSDADYEFLDPIMGPCWATAADIFIQQLDDFESAWPPVSTADVRGDIGTLLYAVSRLSTKFTMLVTASSKIQKRLAQAGTTL